MDNTLAASVRLAVYVVHRLQWRRRVQVRLVENDGHRGDIDTADCIRQQARVVSGRAPRQGRID